jgi:hypothetical protein
VINYAARDVPQRAVNFSSTTDATVFHSALAVDAAGRQLTQRRAGGALTGQTATGAISNADRLVGNVFTGTAAAIYLDGALRITGSQDTTVFSPTTFTVGAFKRTFLSDYAAANISEILVVSSTLNEADRQKLEGYLAHKWGLRANLPSDHPYKLAPPY